MSALLIFFPPFGRFGLPFLEAEKGSFLSLMGETGGRPITSADGAPVAFKAGVVADVCRGRGGTGG